MRYFLDCEYDGFGGPLLTLALVPEDGSEEYYAVLDHARPLTDWVERHVAPYFDHVPAMLRREPQPAADVARDLSAWLAGLSEVEIVADWPEDLALFCRLLVTGNGEVVDMPPLSLRWLRTPGFSTARNSAVPHNALHDARALRDHVVSHLD
ncbi:hypothetical protein GCM10022280_25840 [Sphingomonas swuensis]|uniref:Uncharacterized protein n=1 Tax=Sphingomonas swuensis TaxID=977800 RepID=A0ABP7TBK4_9SPHN